jgi:hypothetical protein
LAQNLGIERIPDETERMNMKIARLFQPRNPLFWIMIILNVLSSGIAFVLHAREWPFGVQAVLAGFALANGLLGVGIALRLMRSASRIE